MPLPESEVRGIWRSVCRYRARWRVQGHQQAWLWKQAARARKGGLIVGRKAGVASRCGAAGWLAHRAATVGRPGRQSSDLVSAFPWGENWVRKHVGLAGKRAGAGPE